MLRTDRNTYFALKPKITETFEIYSASAGSGKTYQLTKAYLSFLLKKDSPLRYRQLLAITFTNKAVGEMKDRILDNLYSFGLEQIPKKNAPLFHELVNELSIEPGELKKRANKTLKDLLHNYAFFDVSTIDRFNHRLLRTFAQDLKIANNFEVVLDTDLLLEEAVARLLTDAGGNEELTQVLMDFTFDKIDDDKSWNIAYDLNVIGKLIFQENHYRHLAKLKKKDINDFLGLKQALLSKLAHLQENLQNNANKALKIIASNGLESSDFYRGWFPDFMASISEGNPNINFNAGWKQDFENAQLYVKNASASDVIEGLRLEFSEIFNTIKCDFHQLLFFKNGLKNLTPLALINEITRKVNALKDERSLVPISEFNTIISEEIKNQPIPYIYERLGEKYRHYFIDEFQDTSLMQWQNLIPLIGNALESENELGERGSLLLVGDVKQAIYRWRGGRAEQFLNMVNLNTNPFSVASKAIQMGSNWRSHSEIVNFNNSFFTHIAKNLRSNAHQRLFEVGSEQKNEKKEPGYVELIFVDNEKEVEADVYCQETLGLVQKVCKEGYAYQDICILVRKNKYGTLIAKYLAQNNIPVVSQEALLLKENDSVLFLMAFLRHIHDFTDQNAFYDVLAHLAPNNNAHDFVRNYLNAPNTFHSDYGIDAEYLRQLSAYDMVEWLAAKFSLFEDSGIYIYQFMDMIFEVENREGIGIQKVIHHWEAKSDKLAITAPESIAAVRVMTVHKAKGLEFPVVIFPYADAKIINPMNKKIWVNVNEQDFKGFDELLFDYSNSLRDVKGHAQIAFQREQENLELDAYNVLYVAMTRAIEALFVITAKPASSKKAVGDSDSTLFVNYLQHLQVWDETENNYNFGKLMRSQTEEDKVAHEKTSYESLSPSLQFQQKPRISSGFESSATHLGELFHHFMSLIEVKPNPQKAIDELKNEYHMSFEEEEFLLGSYQKIVNHPEIGKYFKNVDLSYNEKDILHPQFGVVRPDRIVVMDNKATLIDYKTGKRAPSHLHQMERYVAVVEGMGYEIDKKLLVYINNENIETVII